MQCMVRAYVIDHRDFAEDCGCAKIMAAAFGNAQTEEQQMQSAPVHLKLQDITLLAEAPRPVAPDEAAKPLTGWVQHRYPSPPQAPSSARPADTSFHIHFHLLLNFLTERLADRLRLPVSKTLTQDEQASGGIKICRHANVACVPTFSGRPAGARTSGPKRPVAFNRAPGPHSASGPPDCSQLPAAECSFEIL